MALPWDSGFFLHRIGRLRPDPDEATDLRGIAKLDRSGFDCVFIELDARAVHLLEQWVGLGARIVDLRAVMDLHLVETSSTGADEGVLEASHWSTADRAAAARLVEQLAPLSRFAKDPKLAPFIGDLYRTWFDRALSAEHLALGVRRGGVLAGVLTSSVRDGAAWIELFAVDERSRRRGIGTMLLRAFRSRARASGMRTAHVRTPLHDVPAVRVYERAGFRTSRASFALHWWNSARAAGPR